MSCSGEDQPSSSLPPTITTTTSSGGENASTFNKPRSASLTIPVASPSTAFMRHHNTSTSRNTSPISSPFPDSKSEWKWIGKFKFVDGEYIQAQEGPTLDYKLTVIKEYIKFEAPAANPLLYINTGIYEGRSSGNSLMSVSSPSVDKEVFVTNVVPTVTKPNASSPSETPSSPPVVETLPSQTQTTSSTSTVGAAVLPSATTENHTHVPKPPKTTSHMPPVATNTAAAAAAAATEKKRKLSAKGIKESAYGTEANAVIDYKALGLRLTEYLLAYLNSNGGALIFGVRDDAKVVGMTLTEKQQDKIKLTLDNCIRNFQITPTPKSDTDYRFEFIKTVNDQSKVVLVLEVQKSNKFHYAIIHSNLKSWVRLNASNMSLNERPSEFVKRLRELRDEQSGDIYSDPGSAVSLRSEGVGDEDFKLCGYLKLVFPDRKILVAEKVLVAAGFNANIFRLDSWCQLDDKGRFIVDRPSKYFQYVYQFLQIGAVSMKKVDFPIFTLEAMFYGVEVKEENVIHMNATGEVIVMSDEKHKLYSAFQQKSQVQP